MESLFTPLTEFQNFHKPSNINRLRKIFYRKYWHEDESVFFDDKRKDVFCFCCGSTGETIEVNFENDLRVHLLNITDKIKNVIDVSAIKLKPTERFNFWGLIIGRLDRIVEEHDDLVSHYPVFSEPSKEIKKHLLENYRFEPQTELESSSFLELKPKYGKDDLQNLFNFLCLEGYLNEDKYSFEDFFSVFNHINSDKKIEFNCTTLLMVLILEKMSTILFNNLTRKKIENSGRFLTKETEKKESSVLTVSNYGKNISKLRMKKTTEIKKIETFFEKNFNN